MLRSDKTLYNNFMLIVITRASAWGGILLLEINTVKTLPGH